MTQEQLIALGWQLAGWVLTLAAPPMAVYAIRWAKGQAEGTQFWKLYNKTALLTTAAAQAVKYAEQTIDSNPVKKKAAIEFVQAFLDVRGIHFPVNEIYGAVEAAVYTELEHESAAVAAPAQPAPKP